MSGSHQTLLLKTRVFTVIVVVTNVIGNLALSRGMRSMGSLVSQPPSAYVAALFNPWVAFGVLFLIAWLLAHMMLLSWADLSYVLPVTAIGYVLIALGGRYVLHEEVSPGRWLGIAAIVAGVTLVSRTAPSTHPRAESQQE